MPDVGKVEGPSGPSNQGRKDQKAVDADKFKETKRRIDEVRQIDPDEQKKRKQRGEEEEESALSEGPATPPPPPASFQPDSQKSPSLNIQKGKNLGSAPYKPMAHYPTSSFSETEEESGISNQESSAPALSEPQNPPVHQEFTEPPIPSSAPPPEQKTTHPTTHHSKTHHEAAKTKDKNAKPGEKDLGAIPLPSKEETSGFFEQIEKKPLEEPPPLKKGPETEEEAEAALLEGMVPPSTEVRHPEEKKEESKKAEELTLETSLQGLETQLPPLDSAPQLEPMPAYTRLPPDVSELFDRMVGVMTVMQVSGLSETTFTLNSPQFASSVFFGSQIIIQEYSTAPKAFNIQLNGSPQAVALFQGNADELMAAFQNGGFGYRVNRLQTGHLEEKPLFKRKEKLSGDNEDQTGPGP